MQPVHKKSPSAGKVKTLFLFILFAAAIAAAIVLLCNAFPGKNTGLPEVEDLTIQLIDQPKDSLIKLHIVPSSEASFTLIKEGNEWQMDGMPGFDVDPAQLDLMIKDFSVLVANQLMGRVHQDEESLAALGLGLSAPRATATYLNGKSITLVFGADAKTEVPSDYLMVLGDDRVYGVSQETRGHFDRSAYTLHAIPSLGFNTDLIQTVRFQGDQPVTLHQEDGWWQIADPVKYPVDAAAMEDLLNRISKMRLAVYAGDATEDNLEKHGLKNPRRIISLELPESVITQFDDKNTVTSTRKVPAQSLVFSVGNNIDTLGFYCLYNNKIYQVSNVSMGFLRDTKLSSLISSAPASIPINRLHSIKVRQNNMTRTYTVNLTEQILPNNQFATDDQGNILYSPYILQDGVEINSDGFSASYVKLASIRRQGKLPDRYQVSEQKPVVSFHFTGQSIDFIIEFFPYDALHYAMQVNGVSYDFVNKNEVDQIGL